ncbi:peptidase M50 [Euryarchaeota archaeon ex4484_178]|nr:MAG: peptidase M50 [Euryarchaeota archaeon ex4484_178]
MNYPYLRPKFRFYPEEIRDIAIAIATLTVSFAILISPFPYGAPSFMHFIVAFIAVITAFFLHEMAHKFMAFKYGYPAAFKAWKTGLMIALLSSFFGFLFAAPGAVYIYGYPTREENGKISTAGPATNITAGFLFLLLSLILSGWNIYMAAILIYVAHLNFFLALFNTIPIGPMDGLKILNWNVGIFISLLLLSVLGLVTSYWILPP